MNHTPTPWRLHDRKVHILNQHGSVIAQVNLIEKHIRLEDNITEMHANADFVVTACNAHEDLVKALQEVREYFSDCADADAEGDPLAFKPNKEMTILDEIEKALAKAGVTL